MIYEKILLKNSFETLKDSSNDPILHVYVAGNSMEINPDKRRPAIVICPGGGYEFTSDREAEPVALKFLAKGHQAFVLDYSVAPNRFPTQLLELSAAIALIRRNADKWGVDTEKIAVCGFSAGGHLTGTLANHWNEEFIQKLLDIKQGENKPNKIILSYPVITAGEFAHRGSFENLLGKNLTTEINDHHSLENTVNEHTPPTFLWHTANDASVPVQNTLLFANALIEKNIPLEMHIYPEGIHGISLADESTAHMDNPEQINSHVSTWFDLAIEWLKC